jgi:hypothetical protein
MGTMASKTVFLPTTYDEVSDFATLFNLRNTLENSPDDIVFNFSRCTFLKHNAVAIIGGIAQLLRSQGRSVEFDWTSATQPVLANLNRNRFRSHFSNQEFSYYGVGNSIPYRHDLTKDKQSQLTYLLDYWLGRGWVDMSELLSGYVAGAVWEGYENAFSHAGSKIGVFSCGQHFPNIHRLSLCVADFGAGISNRVQSFWAARMRTANISTDVHMALSILSSQAQALKWAFVKGTSTRPTPVGGLGLHTLKKLIELNQGSMMVFSNEAYMLMTADGEQYHRHNASFGGTVVNISLRCDADETRYCLVGEL